MLTLNMFVYTLSQYSIIHIFIIEIKLLLEFVLILCILKLEKSGVSARAPDLTCH